MSALPAGRLLVLGMTRQGYGDAILTARYVPALRAVLGDRALVVRSPLARLCRPLAPVVVGCDDVWSALERACHDPTTGSVLLDPPADPILLAGNGHLYRHPLGTDVPLPPAFTAGWGPCTCGRAGAHALPVCCQPAAPACVRPPPATFWADPTIRVPAGAGARRVGLCWTGSGGGRDVRGVPPAALAPLVRVAGVAWWALHLADHAALGPTLPNLTDLGVRDWADTAGVLRQLDLVITVDTAVFHLAGSLGVPAWLLLGYGLLADQRWTVAYLRAWYPSVGRIFRQDASRNWASVIAEVRQALVAWGAGRAAAPALRDASVLA